MFKLGIFKRFIANFCSILEKMPILRVFSKKSVLLQIIKEIQVTSERVTEIEKGVHDVNELVRYTEERTKTIQYQTCQAISAINYQLEMLQQWYVETELNTPKWIEKLSCNQAREISLETDYPLALMSNDHLNPDSTAEGIVRPVQFVANCIDVLGCDIRCLDLGTGAAGLVFEYVKNNIVGVGIDGSDYCRRYGIGFWPLLIHNLYTCDITHPFCFKKNDGSMQFDVITMWEVFEHIPLNNIRDVLANVLSNLKPSGYFIGSISTIEYNGADGICYHVTIKEKEWWKNEFLQSGLVILEKHPFNERFFCRGNGPRFQDIHNYFRNPSDGFHFVAQKIL